MAPMNSARYDRPSMTTAVNSVVVFGTADDLRLVLELIDKLDIVLRRYALNASSPNHAR